MNPWRHLVGFVSERESPTALALCRIIAGATVLGHVLHFQQTGAADFALVHKRYGGIGLDDSVLSFVGGATPTHVTLLIATLALSSLLATIGLFTRPALVITWAGMRLLSALNTDARGAYDALMIDGLFVLMLSGCGRGLSVDARLFRRPDDDGLVSRWPRILLVLQMGFLYGGSAIMKASSGWVPGGDASALWYILHQPMWARGNVDAIPLWALPLTQIATTLVWLWELCGPLFVVAVLLRERPSTWRPLALAGRALDRVRFREIYLVIGVLMHVGIELTMEVGAFTFASLALYPAALRAAEWDRLRR